MVTAAGTPAGYGPADLQSAYALPGGTAGAGQTVYVVDAYDDPSAESDLATYRSTYGLPPCTTANGCFAKLNQSGAAAPLPVANSGWAAEESLDLDMVSAVCPACNIRLIEANDHGGGLYTAVHEAVLLGARFISMSWGGGEFSGETSYDSYFNAPGVLFAASTGDNGAAGGPSYPAMSPNVLAVGGTSLRRAANSRGWSETAWSGAGSGCSAIEAKPAWQAFIDSGTCTRRAGADVSAVADPGTGVAVVNGGGWSVFGGTSASAPVVTAIYALAGTPAATSAPQSFPYENSTSFTDVTSGSTGSCAAALICNAATGWDGPTGLGTPIGTAAVTDSGTSSAPPPPTALGATLSVSSPVVPGLSTTATVTPMIPAGRTLASIAWSSSRADCSFAPADSASTTISCGAAATGSATISARVTDSTRATKTVSAPLAFDTITRSGLALSVSFDGQTGATASLCTSALSPLVATVTDTASGEPVKGVRVTVTKQPVGTTSAYTVATGLTGAAGTVSLPQLVTAAATYRIFTTAVGDFAASAPDTVGVTVTRCTLQASATASTQSAWYGDAVTVSGTVTRPDPSGSGTLPVVGLRVPVTLTLPPTTTSTGATVPGRVIQLATPATAPDGTYTASVKATASGELGATIAGSPSFTPVSADAGPLTVNIPTTTLTTPGYTGTIAYGDKVTVSGVLTATGASTYPVAYQSVAVKEAVPGVTLPRLLGSLRTGVDGSVTGAVMPTASGTITLVFAGAPGLPAATATVGTVTVDSWTPSLQLSAGSTEVGYGTPVTFSGSVTRTSPPDGTGPAAWVPLKIVLTPTSGNPVTLASTMTTTGGTFTVRGTPLTSGTVSAVLTNVAGYVNGASAPVAITVDTWTPAITAHLSASSVTSGSVMTVSGTVTRSCAVASGAAAYLAVKVYLTPSGSSTPTLLRSVLTTSTGSFSAPTVPRASGTVTVVVSGVPGYISATSPGMALTVT